jgi:predicted  nucleic acid-binding Zn-ribbon protein
MRCQDVAPSHLSSLLLPCPHCGHRMVIVAAGPVQLANGAASNDLEDVTHGCVQCGTRLTRTVSSLAGAARPHSRDRLQPA